MKFEDLNPRQRQAASHYQGPMLVVAGAGTGKTTVMSQRIARLRLEHGVRLNEILAITYTDKAAGELVERVESALRQNLGDVEFARIKKSGEEIQPSTFHAYAYRVLQRCGVPFQILEENDLYVFLRRRFAELGLNHYTKASSPGEFIKSLLDFFDQCHDELKNVEDYEKYVEEVAAGRYPLPRVLGSKKNAELHPDEIISRCREIAGVFRKVEEMLAEQNLGSFGHLFFRAFQLLKSNAQLLEQERQRARYILVDEFQDCNVAQIELVQLLAGEDRNVFAVGDPDQSIYKFRGASSAAFEEFVQRFPDSKGVVLNENLRSLEPILQCAHAIIGKNPEVSCKVGESGPEFRRQGLVSVREQAKHATTKSSPVHIVVACGKEDEAGEVAETIGELRRKQPRRVSAKGHTRFAVLYRYHVHRAEIMRELAERDIPYVVRGVDALETGEVRDILACLRAVLLHDGESTLRVAALSRFSIDPQAARAELLAGGREVSIEKTLRKLSGGEAVFATLDKIRGFAAKAEWHTAAVVRFAIAELQLTTSSPAVCAFTDFVAKWCEKPITTTPALSEFLEYVRYYAEAGGMVEVPEEHPDPADDPVSLMTVHAAKGLEFDHVFVLRANTSQFPSSFKERLFEYPKPMRHERSLSEDDGKKLHMEEERRLFYVAMTRAKDSLTICCKNARAKFPRPGGFVRELIDAKHVVKFYDRRNARAFQLELAAAAEDSHTTGIGHWLLLAPSSRALEATLSASAIDKYENCPLQYKIYRDWNLPGEVAAQLTAGSLMHEVLREYYNSMIAGRPQDPDALIDYFNQQMTDLPFDDEDQRSLYRRQGERQLRMFFARGPSAAAKHTETAFTILVGPTKVKVRGRIDRVDLLDANSAAIIDYKTGAPKNEEYVDKSLQLSIYALAAREKFGLHARELVIHNLANDTLVSTRRSDDQLKETEEKIVNVAAKIAAGEFPANPGYACRTCDYSRICPHTEERIHVPLRALTTSIQ